jgi:hypothetical protein
LFGGTVGKDTVSRTWRKVKSDWDAWNTRALAEEPIARLILDGHRSSRPARRQTCSSAFQNPSAPSATASSGPIVSPRRLRSRSISFPDCVLSRTPPARPANSFLPSGAAPAMTNRP